MTLDYSTLPDNMRGGMERYIQYGIRPGGCLSAILANDLMQAVGRADEKTLAGLWSICSFLHSHAPVTCYGDWQTVEEWIAKGGLEGKSDE